ncbi:MAG: hypothetical protein M3036_09390, partial [Bifidobacteriales bacterium]|nr:hypothetical protein [Bifidobacteriales bacterium]
MSRRHIDGLGEKRLHIAVLRIAHQPFDQMNYDGVGVAVAVDAWDVAANIRALRDIDVTSLREAAGRHQDCSCEKYLFHVPLFFH